MKNDKRAFQAEIDQLLIFGFSNEQIKSIYPMTGLTYRRRLLEIPRAAVGRPKGTFHLHSKARILGPEIRRRKQAGETYQQIAECFGLSRQRIQQMISPNDERTGAACGF